MTPCQSKAGFICLMQKYFSLSCPCKCPSILIYFWTFVLQLQLVLYHDCNSPIYTTTSTCSDRGEVYAKKLANFVERRLKSERAASVSFINMNDSDVHFFSFTLKKHMFVDSWFVKDLCGDPRKAQAKWIYTTNG